MQDGAEACVQGRENQFSTLPWSQLCICTSLVVCEFIN